MWNHLNGTMGQWDVGTFFVGVAQIVSMKKKMQKGSFFLLKNLLIPIFICIFASR